MSSNHGARTALVLLKLLGILANVLIITHAGRRRTLALSMAALAVVAGAVATAHVVRAPSHVQAAVVVLWMLVFELCAITLFILPGELYPTVVRGAGLALCYTCGRMGAFAAPFLNRIHSEDMKGLLHVRRGGRAAALLRTDGAGVAGDDAAAAGQHDAGPGGGKVAAALSPEDRARRGQAEATQEWRVRHLRERPDGVEAGGWK
ncbi:hypothetical protein V5799_032986 [Amblyomma americanum]|uniref:Uncharacterized protein n=1 Tax=Amblyomma americanum TaxID=6943 RepID=A0AAQ4DPL8_AMBAM